MLSKINHILVKEIKEPTQVETFSRKHIFHDLKKNIKNISKQEHIFDLYYCFFIYEKSLELATNKRLNAAKYWLLKAESLHKELPIDTTKYLKLLYNPALAFYYYKKENFEQAHYILSQTIENIEKYVEDKVLKLEFKLEQLINRYRIFCSEKKYKEAKNIAVHMINFIIHNEKFEELKNDDIENVKTSNYINYLSWVNYILNSIFVRIERNKQLEQGIFRDLICNIKPIHQKEFQYLSNTFTAILAYFENNRKKQLISTHLAFEKIYQLPEYLQVALLSCLKEEDDFTENLYSDYLLSRYGIRFEFHKN